MDETKKTKILFVDDEPNVLSGLRRMLRSQRKVWEMHFANGGLEAVEFLENEPVDVIVTDMRMPEIDGAALLNMVSERYPDTVRLVLSGQSEHEKIFRAVGPAHQFLSKPCDPQLLIDTVQRACGLRSHLQAESLKRITSRMTQLPSLPAIYQELVQELRSDEASMQRVSEKIEADLAMSAKVLQLVNSSFFGMPRRVSSPAQAVSLLGLNVIRPLVLTAGVFAQYDQPKIEGFSLRKLISHSLAVATRARKIAEAKSRDHQLIDDAFIAGLMHDIGKLVLATNLPEEYEAILATHHATGEPLHQCEFNAIQANHAQIGAHLLGLWGIPNSIVEAIAYHHCPTESGSTSFGPVTAVHVANAMEHAIASGQEDHESEQNWDARYLQSIGEATQIVDWKSQLLEGVLQ